MIVEFSILNIIFFRYTSIHELIVSDYCKKLVVVHQSCPFHEGREESFNKSETNVSGVVPHHWEKQLSFYAVLFTVVFYGVLSFHWTVLSRKLIWTFQLMLWWKLFFIFFTGLLFIFYQILLKIVLIIKKNKQIMKPIVSHILCSIVLLNSFSSDFIADCVRLRGVTLEVNIYSIWSSNH